MRKYVLNFALILLFALNLPLYAFASEEGSSYQIVIEDQADLLSDSQEEELLYYMNPITEYGSAAFFTISNNSYSSTGYFASSKYHELFGRDSGILFVIDMYYRNIYIFSDGAIYQTITEDYADIITDNSYTYASDEDYYKCASYVFEQAYDLLQGKDIPMPMKYICNALLAIVIAALLNYFIISVYTSKDKASNEELLTGIANVSHFNNTNATLINHTTVYISSSSSSDSSGDSSSSDSGGGGGHSF